MVNTGKLTSLNERDAPKHYHQFVDACLGKDEVSAPFSYSARLTETILLGVIAGQEANAFLSGSYRDF